MTTTYTIYEYTDADPDLCEPIEPAFKRTIGQLAGVAVALQPQTRFVTIKPSAQMNVRLSKDGSAATTDDYQIAAQGVATFPVIRNTGVPGPFVYGL